MRRRVSQDTYNGAGPLVNGVASAGVGGDPPAISPDVNVVLVYTDPGSISSVQGCPAAVRDGVVARTETVKDS